MEMTKDELCSLITELADINIKITPLQMEEYSRRWSDPLKNFSRTPGNFTADTAVELLKKFGADVVIEGNDLTVKKSALTGIEIDVGDIPDLVPVLSVLACYAKGKTRIYNAARLRYKESDRLQAMYEELSKMGADISVGDDYLEINGGKKLVGAEVESHNDHRIVMSMAVASVGCEGKVTICGCHSVEKSYPDFFDDWSNLNE